MSPEERKIKRLEAENKRLKQDVERLETNVNLHKGWLHSEREWRRHFQQLMKAAALEDSLDCYDRYGY